MQSSKKNYQLPSSVVFGDSTSQILKPSRWRLDLPTLKSFAFLFAVILLSTFYFLFSLSSASAIAFPMWEKYNEDGLAQGVPYVTAVSSDGKYIYIGGYQGTYEWRLEKRNAITGELEKKFNKTGVYTSNNSACSRIVGIYPDGTGVHIVGYASGCDVKITHLNEFGTSVKDKNLTTQSGIGRNNLTTISSSIGFWIVTKTNLGVLLNDIRKTDFKVWSAAYLPSSVNLYPQTLARDNDYLYLGGRYWDSTNSKRWLEKVQLSTLTSTGSYYDDSATHPDPVSALAADGTNIYIGVNEIDGNSVLYVFDRTNINLSKPMIFKLFGINNLVTDIEVDVSGVYVARRETGSKSVIEKYNQNLNLIWQQTVTTGHKDSVVYDFDIYNDTLRSSVKSIAFVVPVNVGDQWYRGKLSQQLAAGDLIRAAHVETLRAELTRKTGQTTTAVSSNEVISILPINALKDAINSGCGSNYSPATSGNVISKTLFNNFSATIDDCFLVNNQHTPKECLNAGGTVLSDASGKKFCKFSAKLGSTNIGYAWTCAYASIGDLWATKGSQVDQYNFNCYFPEGFSAEDVPDPVSSFSCPSAGNWQQYSTWRSTIGYTCNSGSKNDDCTTYSESCAIAGSSSFAQQNIDSCDIEYWSGGNNCGPVTCNAIVYSVGCY